MPTDLPTKVQVALWWITSIAASVLCCSVLFVLFATHLVDIRGMVKDTNDRISIIEAREERILAEIELIRKRAVFQPVQPTAATAVEAPVEAATEAPASVSVSGSNPNKEPESISIEVPVAPPVAPTTVPATVPPAKK
ncbi:MAG: hypothetical protein WC521_05820 [Bdellovibrionales bacterium]